MNGRLLRTLLCLAMFCTTPAWAAKYPSKPVTIIVPVDAGGPTDTLVRLLAQHMGKTLHTFVKVENVAGSGGAAAVERAAASPPDGYTVLFHHGALAAIPPLAEKGPYDGLRDLEPIGVVGDIAMALIARVDYPAADLYELLSLITAGSGTARLANAGPGTDSHLCGMLFSSATRTDLAVVPVEVAAPAVNSLYAGQADLLCDHITDKAAAIRLGRIKAYGLTTATAVEAFRGIPTLRDAGIPEFDVPPWRGLYAPKGTPQAVLDALARALQAALEDPRLRYQLADLGTIPALTDKATPTAMRELLREESKKWAPILKKPGDPGARGSGP